MKKISSLLLLSFIMFSAFIIFAANPTITLTPISPTTICATTNDTFAYSVNASNIPINTNVVIYQSTDSTFNPTIGQGDSIGFVKGDTTSTSIITTVCPKILGIFIDACNDNDRLEPANEYMVITSGQGFRAANLKIDLPNTNLRDINTGANPCSFGTPSATLMTLLRTGFCNSTNLIAATQADSIPPNALVIVFTGAGTDYPYNLSRFCQTGQKVYILQNACVNGSGAFTNNDAAGTTCSGTVASSRYRTTTLANRNCFDKITYDRCGLNEFDGANPNANDGNYVIRLDNTDTSSVANNGIQNNAADRCNGIVLDSIIKSKILKFAIPNTFCNTGFRYIKAVLKPNTTPTTVSNTLQYKYVCNDVRAAANSTNICTGEKAIIDISSTNPNATFSWTISGGNNISGASAGTGNQINQTLSYTGATNDNVTYNITSNDAGCTKTTSVNVVVKNCDTCNLRPIITGKTTICNNESTTLSVAGQYDSIRWNTGATTSSINVNQAANYVVTVYLGACSASANVDVISTLLLVSITGADIVCGGTFVTLTTNGQFDSLRWNTNATTTSINVTQQGTYTVTAYSNGCSAIATFNVGRISIDYFLDKKSANICSGDTAKFILSAGDLGSSPVDTFIFTQPGRYLVSYQTPNCGLFIDSVFVTRVTSPIPFTLGNDTSYCGNFTKILSTGNPTTVWSTGVTASQISVSTAGTYIATISNTCGSVSDTIVITQNQTPNIFIGNDTAFCDGVLNLSVDAGQNVRSILWNTGAETNTIQVATVGTYSVKVTNTSNCSDSDAINISSNCVNEIWLPNAFTPNNDGANDVFYVRGNPQNIVIERFLIFNRWGNKVFEANDILPDDKTKGWNGTYKNQTEQVEVYGYEVRARFTNGEKRTLKGNVTLLK